MVTPGRAKLANLRTLVADVRVPVVGGDERLRIVLRFLAKRAAQFLNPNEVHGGGPKAHSLTIAFAELFAWVGNRALLQLSASNRMILQYVIIAITAFSQRAITKARCIIRRLDRRIAFTAPNIFGIQRRTF